ncbi:MAG: hypothetical protein AABW65_02110 [Nanoarchaeota archaeon]
MTEENNGDKRNCNNLERNILAEAIRNKDYPVQTMSSALNDISYGCHEHQDMYQHEKHWHNCDA